ncbi:unnamed protein product [Rhizoctonia solani]|uniref:Xylanolytic transcriptional activator regulatory domain-containing protein n=1 Tax=Rhizoctonia solani TaxID=456999 RepID=A0A8H3B1A8_9AGAM|nr:unnamed protein product [Rhizoctonia solani]
MEPEYEAFIGSSPDAASGLLTQPNVNPLVSVWSTFLVRGAASGVRVYLVGGHQRPRKAEQLWEGFIAAFRSKVHRWQTLDHVHVVRLLGTIDSLDLCVEFCANGTASEYLESHAYNDGPLRQWMIASGRLPYFKIKHDLRVINEIISKKPPGYRNKCPSPEFTDFWPLLTDYWRWEPEQRPQIRALAQEAFSLVSAPRTSSWLDVSSTGSSALTAVGEGAHSLVQAEPEVLSQRNLSPATHFVPESPQNLVTKDALRDRVCDRCYTSKSRCIYQQSSDICTRCQSMGANCVYTRSNLKARDIKRFSENISDLSPRPGDSSSRNITSTRLIPPSWLPWNYELVQSIRGNIESTSSMGDQPGVGREELAMPRNIPELRPLSIITEDDAENLFIIFREKMNAGIMIFDDTIHIPTVVKSRCPALFTTICAIASQYWVESPDSYRPLMLEAVAQIDMTLNHGWKLVDICQACLLLSVHPPWTPEGSNSYLYLESAIRLGIQLELSDWSLPQGLDETSQREALNKARTWLVCLKMDRMLSSRYGHPVSTPQEHLHRYSGWWHLSPFNQKLDVHLYYETRVLDTVTMDYIAKLYSILSQPVEIDGFNALVNKFDLEMQVYQYEVEQIGLREQEMSNLRCRYQQELIASTITYFRLVLLTFGLDYFWKPEDQHVIDLFFRVIDRVGI